MKMPLLNSALVLFTLLVGTGTGYAKPITVTVRFIPPTSGGVTAECEAVTSIPLIHASRTAKIRWKLKKDEDSPCPGFDANQVDVQFEAANIVDDDNNPGPQTHDKGHHHALSADRAEGTVSDMAAHRPKPYKYQIMYKSKLAQDPELDVAQ